ncbi:tRNA lysidine(34) synthetase TilS [Methylobacterium sp. BTF04]|nr:tRNA lysidine(34) synthetase TilS [Methylobacterium sp. BTF04]
MVLAVSGGPDSTALMQAAARVGGSGQLHVATIDHGLRAESAAEAQSVGFLARRLGLAHHILPWTDGKPAHGIQAAARAARYTLLAEFARHHGARLILTGHTRDDQAETVLMRLLAGSGPAGLAGMRRERNLGDGVHLARPFLAIPKADLVAYCEAMGLAFVSDPSNYDARFARARLRRLMPELAGEGLSTARLCRLSERVARDDDALARAARNTLAEVHKAKTVDGLVLDGAGLVAVADAIVLRVVALALEQAGGGGVVRLERLEHLVLDAILPALRLRMPLRRTLSGLLFEATRTGDLRVGPAPPRRPTHPRLGTDGDGLAAGPTDLLGKESRAAYIALKRPD